MADVLIITFFMWSYDFENKSGRSSNKYYSPNKDLSRVIP